VTARGGLSALALLTAVWAAGCASAPSPGPGLVLTVEDADRGRVLAREPVAAGARIDLTYVHSTEGRPVRATFRVEADGRLRLVETAYPSVGPGLPAGSEATVTIEDGWIVARAPGPPLGEFRLRPLPLTRHRLVLPSGRALDLSALVEPGAAVRLIVR
jgi:hypothetical protein